MEQFKSAEIKIKELAKPFPRELISWRVGATNSKKNNGKPTKGIALAYIDARDVMQRLDEVCGPHGWQNKHPHANGKTSCAIGIKINGEWVWKENGAGDSATEAEKGAFSDSFKRAAVLWGIGRYLYDVPNIWVELDDWGAIKNPQDERLQKALAQAEKGIRGQHEKDDTKPKELTPQQVFLKKAKDELTAIKTPQELIEWSRVNGPHFVALSEKQKEWIDKEISTAKARTAQGEV